MVITESRILAILPLLLMGAATVDAQQQWVTASKTYQIVTTDSTVGQQSTPWMTVLKATPDTSDSDSNGLLVSTSAMTLLSTTDSIAGNNVIAAGGGIQARVLIDCVKACNPASDTIPAANLATPGVVTFDETLHYVTNFDPALIIQKFNENGGAHGFNFYKTGVSSHQHTVLLQVKLQVAAATLTGLTVQDAAACVGPRTMVITSIGIGEENN